MKNLEVGNNENTIKIIEEELEAIQEMINYHDIKIEELRDEIKNHYKEIYNYECQINRLEKIIIKIKGEKENE